MTLEPAPYKCSRQLRSSQQLHYNKTRDYIINYYRMYLCITRSHGRWSEIQLQDLSLLKTFKYLQRPSDSYFCPVTMPVTSASSASAERSVSSLKTLKTYLLPTMGADRLSSLALRPCIVFIKKFQLKPVLFGHSMEDVDIAACLLH